MGLIWQNTFKFKGVRQIEKTILVSTYHFKWIFYTFWLAILFPQAQQIRHQFSDLPFTRCVFFGDNKIEKTCSSFVSHCEQEGWYSWVLGSSSITESVSWTFRHYFPNYRWNTTINKDQCLMCIVF